MKAHNTVMKGRFIGLLHKHTGYAQAVSLIRWLFKCWRTEFICRTSTAL